MLIVNSISEAKKILYKKFKSYKISKDLIDLLAIIYFNEDCTLDKIHEFLPQNQQPKIQALINKNLIISHYDEFNDKVTYNVSDLSLQIINSENQLFTDAFNLKSKLQVIKAIKTLLHYIYLEKINRKLIWSTLFFSIIASVFLSLSLFTMAELPQIFALMVTDRGNLANHFKDFTINISLMAGFYIFQILFNFLQNIFFVYISQNMGFNIRKEMFYKIQKLPFSYMDRQSAGNVMSLFTNDVDSIIFTIVQNVATIINSIFNVIAIFITMFILNYLLASVTVLLTAFLLAFIFIFIKKSQPHFMAQQTKLADINGDVVEAMNVHKMTTIFEYQDQMQKTFKTKNKSLAKSSYFAQLISGIIFPYNNFVTNFVVTIVSLLIVALYIFNQTLLITTSPLGKDPVSLMLLFIIVIRQFTTPISNFFFTINSFQLAFAATNRINEFLNEKNESSDENKGKLKVTNANIEFKNVSFKYNKYGKNIINDLNLVLKPNTVNAIAGPTGSGKTTIISLLTRFYDVNEGNIYIDGVNINEVSRESIRENISIVLQDSYLFSTTILENIRCANPKATREDVIKAAKLSNAHDFIMRLPNGYDTRIDNGIELISAGEKQLIAIARAFLSKAKIIIFDEATSYVDTKTEKDIQEAMMKLMKNRTSILIAHRLSTIRDADQIAIIKDGILIEKGNHDKLMKNKGFYYKLNSSNDEDMDIK